MSPAWQITFLFLCLVIILLGSKIFTNGLEWLGTRLKLPEGVVGSVLAAVGTALPETIIPLIAILRKGGEEGTHIGIGAILGAPFMLSTLAFFIAGLAVMLNSQKRYFYPLMNVNLGLIRRDLKYFLVFYTMAILAVFSPYEIKVLFAACLLLFYGLYVWGSRHKGDVLSKSHGLSPLFFAKYSSCPSLKIILFQTLFALSLVIFGANIFVDAVEWLANYLGVPPFVLALIIAPIATELPEKFNSIIWLRKEKDTLALANITGAMVFQSSVVPALGLIFTPWSLTPGAMLSGVLALLAALMLYLQSYRQRGLTPYMLTACGIFYLFFLSLVLLKMIPV